MSSLDLPRKTVDTLKNGFQIQILFINQVRNTKEPKATISSRDLAQDRDLLDVLLKHLRKMLGKRADSKWSFCLENCAPVEDSSTLLYYITLEEANVKKIQIPATPQPGQQPVEVVALPVLSAYMTTGNSMAPVPTGFGAEWAEKHKPDLSSEDRSKSELGAPGLSANNKAEYMKEGAWAASKTDPGASGMLDCVVDFADNDWDKIMMLNKVLYAFDVRHKKLEITSARLQAFEMKDLIGTNALSSPIPNDAVDTTHLRPFVEIYDTPHIDIAEVSSEFQTSLVNNAFSAKSLEAMVSGGNPMISASASAGIKSESSRGSGSSEGGQKKEFHATYNFPRVRLFLDENTMSVSKRCKSALMALKSAPTLDNLRQFQLRFGVIFAQEVILGGRLEATKAADSQSNAANSSAKDALKASLGAAFSYGPAAASMSASTNDQTSRDTSLSEQQGRSALSYTARGGNTLLCADPAAWAASVAVWRNWRVIQQDEPITLQTLLGRFEEYRFVPDLFASILQKSPPATKLPEPVREKVLDVNRKWTETSKIQLWIGQDRTPSMVFAVRDGDPNNEGAGPRQSLRADYPLLLFQENTYGFPGRDASTVYVDEETGVLGPQSHNKGPYRFSFRKLGSPKVWQPLSDIELVNGDKVTMWCHSVGLGGWTSLDNPPDEAYQAHFNKETKEIKVATGSAKLTAVVGYEPAIFNIEFL